jgi:hypothetical protein
MIHTAHTVRPNNDTPPPGYGRFADTIARVEGGGAVS